MASKPEIIAEKILKRIHIHDPDKGGIFSITTGSMGSAKTSVISSFADYTAVNHPTEKIFWSECYRSPIQVFKLKTPHKFFVMDGIDLKFRDRNNHRQIIDMEYTTFSDFADLYEKASPGVINVPFFGNRLYWMGFIDYLRDVGEWVHVFIDELAEVCPAYTDGILWKYIRDWSKDVLKDVRKDLINLHGDTQSINNIDHRILSYVMINIFLPGARSFKHSRVTQGAIDNLKRDSVHGNSAYLDATGMFGVTRFTDIYKPNSKFHVDVVCNGGRELQEIPFFISNRYNSQMKVA